MCRLEALRRRAQLQPPHPVPQRDNVMTALASAAPVITPPRRSGHAGEALAAAVLGFFVVTLDAVVVNVALPSIRADLGGGITGLQWVVDGCTLLFAALLLSAPALAARSAPASGCSPSCRPRAGWRRRSAR